MDKENVVYRCNRIIFSHKKEGNPVLCGKMDRSGSYYVK
jgi:hypothetical protein